jgi:hypothetical protein
MMPNRLFKDGSTDGVRRLSARQLERHRIYVDPDGRFRWAQDGTPLHTYTGDDYLRREGKAIFAMDERGNLYASPPNPSMSECSIIQRSATVALSPPPASWPSPTGGSLTSPTAAGTIAHPGP